MMSDDDAGTVLGPTATAFSESGVVTQPQSPRPGMRPRARHTIALRHALPAARVTMREEAVTIVAPASRPRTSPLAMPTAVASAASTAASHALLPSMAPSMPVPVPPPSLPPARAHRGPMSPAEKLAALRVRRGAYWSFEGGVTYHPAVPMSERELRALQQAQERMVHKLTPDLPPSRSRAHSPSRAVEPRVYRRVAAGESPNSGFQVGTGAANSYPARVQTSSGTRSTDRRDFVATDADHVNATRRGPGFATRMAAPYPAQDERLPGLPLPNFAHNTPQLLHTVYHTVLLPPGSKHLLERDPTEPISPKRIRSVQHMVEIDERMTQEAARRHEEYVLRQSRMDRPGERASITAPRSQTAREATSAPSPDALPDPSDRFHRAKGFLEASYQLPLLHGRTSHLAPDQFNPSLRRFRTKHAADARYSIGSHSARSDRLNYEYPVVNATLGRDLLVNAIPRSRDDLEMWDRQPSAFHDIHRQQILSAGSPMTQLLEQRLHNERSHQTAMAATALLPLPQILDDRELTDAHVSTDIASEGTLLQRYLKKDVAEIMTVHARDATPLAQLMAAMADRDHAPQLPPASSTALVASTHGPLVPLESTEDAMLTTINERHRSEPPTRAQVAFSPKQSRRARRRMTHEEEEKQESHDAYADVARTNSPTSPKGTSAVWSYVSGPIESRLFPAGSRRSQFSSQSTRRRVEGDQPAPMSLRAKAEQLWRESGAKMQARKSKRASMLPPTEHTTEEKMLNASDTALVLPPPSVDKTESTALDDTVFLTQSGTNEEITGTHPKGLAVTVVPEAVPSTGAYSFTMQSLSATPGTVTSPRAAHSAERARGPPNVTSGPTSPRGGVHSATSRNPGATKRLSTDFNDPDALSQWSTPFDTLAEDLLGPSSEVHIAVPPQLHMNPSSGSVEPEEEFDIDAELSHLLDDAASPIPAPSSESAHPVPLELKSDEASATSPREAAVATPNSLGRKTPSSDASQSKKSKVKHVKSPSKTPRPSIFARVVPNVSTDASAPVTMAQEALRALASQSPLSHRRQTSLNLDADVSTHTDQAQTAAVQSKPPESVKSSKSRARRSSDGHAVATHMTMQEIALAHKRLVEGIADSLHHQIGVAGIGAGKGAGSSSLQPPSRHHRRSKSSGADIFTLPRNVVAHQRAASDKQAERVENIPALVVPIASAIRQATNVRFSTSTAGSSAATPEASRSPALLNVVTSARSDGSSEPVSDEDEAPTVASLVLTASSSHSSFSSAPSSPESSPSPPLDTAEFAASASPTAFLSTIDLSDAFDPDEALALAESRMGSALAINEPTTAAAVPASVSQSPDDSARQITTDAPRLDVSEPVMVMSSTPNAIAPADSLATTASNATSAVNQPKTTRRSSVPILSIIDSEALTSTATLDASAFKFTSAIHYNSVATGASEAAVTAPATNPFGHPAMEAIPSAVPFVVIAAPTRVLTAEEEAEMAQFRARRAAARARRESRRLQRSGSEPDPAPTESTAPEPSVEDEHSEGELAPEEPSESDSPLERRYRATKRRPRRKSSRVSATASIKPKRKAKRAVAKTSTQIAPASDDDEPAWPSYPPPVSDSTSSSSSSSSDGDYAGTNTPVRAHKRKKSSGASNSARRADVARRTRTSSIDLSNQPRIGSHEVGSGAEGTRVLSASSSTTTPLKDRRRSGMSDNSPRASRRSSGGAPLLPPVSQPALRIAPKPAANAPAASSVLVSSERRRTLGKDRALKRALELASEQKKVMQEAAEAAQLKADAIAQFGPLSPRRAASVATSEVPPLEQLPATASNADETLVSPQASPLSVNFTAEDAASTAAPSEPPATSAATTETPISTPFSARRRRTRQTSSSPKRPSSSAKTSRATAAGNASVASPKRESKPTKKNGKTKSIDVGTAAATSKTKKSKKKGKRGGGASPPKHDLASLPPDELLRSLAPVVGADGVVMLMTDQLALQSELHAALIDADAPVLDQAAEATLARLEAEPQPNSHLDESEPLADANTVDESVVASATTDSTDTQAVASEPSPVSPSASAAPMIDSALRVAVPDASPSTSPTHHGTLDAVTFAASSDAAGRLFGPAEIGMMREEANSDIESTPSTTHASPALSRRHSAKRLANKRTPAPVSASASATDNGKPTRRLAQWPLFVD